LVKKEDLMFKKTGELLIPPTAQRDRKALEIARIWAAEGHQHVSLRAGLWPDPACWGMMLVDLAQHVANAYAQEGRSRDEVLQRIKEGFDAEWHAPTDEPVGQTFS
jgi:hypothetical protein